MPAPRLSILPGLALAVVLAAFALGFARFLGESVLGFARSPVSPVLVGIVVGMAIGNLARLPEAFRPGLKFAVTRILRLGIILLGARLSVMEVARLGALGVPVVVTCLAAGLLLTALVNRALALPARLGTLIGVGTAICGVSAIAATGPAIDAEDEEVAYAIAVITVFGMVAMLVYPVVAPWIFGDDPTAIGLFLGTAIHDTSQVNGAGMIYADLHDAPRGLDVAVVTKLLRNLFMLLVVPGMAWAYHRRAAGTGREAAAGGGRAGEAAAGGRRISLVRMFPQFVLGFVAMALVRSIGDAGLAHGGAFGLWDEAAWRTGLGFVKTASVGCLVVALAAVGLGTDFRAMKRFGLKPFLVGLGAALAVGAVSAGVVRGLGLAGWLVGGGS